MNLLRNQLYTYIMCGCEKLASIIIVFRFLRFRGIKYVSSSLLLKITKRTVNKLEIGFRNKN